MSYLYYVLPATLAFLMALYAFLKDDESSKASALNWVFILVTGVLWPITLPFILWKRFLLLFKPVDVKGTFKQIYMLERRIHII